MKKTFPVNINGSIFYIDEDAYQLLNTYLDQLRNAFPGKEGKEIIADIEGRIAELFNEIIAKGARVINLDDTNRVIEQLGRPDALADDPADDRDTGDADTAAEAAAGTTPPPFNGAAQTGPVRKRLYRDERNKVFGGVLSGLACYFNLNTNILRLLVILLAIFSKIIPLFIVYLVAWMIIPPARTPRQILEMTGTPVNLGSLGKTILGTYDNTINPQGSNFFQTFFSILGKIVLIFIGLVAAGVAIGFITLCIACLCGVIIYSGWGSIELLDQIDLFPAAAHPVLGSIGVILICIAVVIPCIALIWGACCMVFKTRGASRNVIITASVLEIILIIAGVVALSVANIEPSFGHIAQVGAVSTTIAGSASFFSLQLS